MPPVLGLARRPSLVAALQPVDRSAPELDGHAYRVYLLDVAAIGRFSSHDGAHHAGHQPALPILDPHRNGEISWSPGIGPEHAVPPLRAPQIEPALHRSQSCRHTHCLGPSLRNV